ncbi:rCG64278 [Rattus norvegicus]|uniref:RCG64278 n=1 Tax=Rattus norvegicus TaxID=10116 RepID=A6JH43_RAT|nr:rCG64278 [Rattus norvegicus]
METQRKQDRRSFTTCLHRAPNKMQQ